MEYQSFHYLMHKVPDAIRPVYVTVPEPLSFAELYSPRPSRILMGKVEKSYWRTRERIEYCFWEDRNFKRILITCRNIDTNLPFRTIFVDAEKLYFEIEAKSRGNRDPLVKKKDKKLVDDASLHRNAVEFLVARLNIKQEECIWPGAGGEPPTTIVEAAVSVLGAAAQGEMVNPSVANEAAEMSPKERMCTLDKLSGDSYDSIELSIPTDFDSEGIEYTKLMPSQFQTPSQTEVATVTTTVSSLAAQQPPSQSAAAPPSTAASSNSVVATPVQSSVKPKPQPPATAATAAASASAAQNKSKQAPNKKKVVPVNS